MKTDPTSGGLRRLARKTLAELGHWGSKLLLLPACLAWTTVLSGAAPATPAPERSGAPGTNGLLLTNAAQVLRLSPEQAKAGPRVRIQGVVTCYDPGRVLFVQDQSAGVFVYHTGDRLALQPGQGVEVTGVAAQGRYSPIVAFATFQPLSSPSTLEPHPASLAQVYLGGLDAQWVELSAVVRTARVVDNRLCLELADPPHRISVWVPQFEGYERRPLGGARVRVRGVVGVAVNGRQEVEGFQLFANTLADVSVLQGPPPDPFADPPCPMRDLRAHLAHRDPAGCIRVRGKVTLVQGHTLFLQDSTGGVEVQTASELGDVSLGRTVDAAGFLGSLLQPPRLEDAVILKLQTNAPPPALRVSAEELAQGLHVAELVEVDARFLGLTTASNVWLLALQAGNQLLNARLETAGPAAGLSELEPDSQVRLTGVCHNPGSAGSEHALELLLRSPADVAVVALPAHQPRPGLQALAAAAILTSAGLALALWFIQKQRARTENLLQLQVTLQAEMRQGEQQLRRSIEERERIARDLHDDIIQSIYAVGLNLEDCRRVVARAPEQLEPRLAGAIEGLNQTIRSCRSFIAGLEPKLLNGREFKTALKSIALTSGEPSGQFQIEVDPAAAERLGALQATQLLHIAKEAMSNSLRHAQAHTVAVSLLPAPAGVCLEVRDDGCGFAPDSAPSSGHGLRNMTARAREIGGELKILSAPGEGCRIVVTVP